MKKFIIKYRYFNKIPEIEFDEEHLPSLFFQSNNKWWYDAIVLKLKVGEIAKTTMYKIIRIA